MLGILQQAAKHLSLTDVVFKKYPAPILKGEYCGYKIALEGGLRKKDRFLAIIELPEPVSERIFIQSEKRKTSLKPIARLKLAATGDGGFDGTFLVLASSPALARAVFQPYLREKILSLSLKDWQMDVHGGEAHLDLRMESPDAGSLAALLSVVFELLNGLSAASKVLSASTE